MNISKRELFEDYYLDEIGAVLREYREARKPPDKGEEIEYVDDSEFFGL